MSPVLTRGSRLFRQDCVLEHVLKIGANSILQFARLKNMNLGITSYGESSPCSIAGENNSDACSVHSIAFAFFLILYSH
jgi:hypothetical protein